MTTATKKATIVSNLTATAILDAINVAQTRWSMKPETIALGLQVSDDLKTAKKFVTDGTVKFISKSLKGMNHTDESFLQVIKNDLGNKAVKRMFQFFNALASGDYKLLDGVTTLDILSGAFAGTVTRDALAFAATGKGNEHTSDNANIQIVRKLQKALGKTVGASSESSMHSRSFGKNGFCKALNLAQMTKDEKGNKIFTVNQKNPLFVACAVMIDTASDSTLELIKGKAKAK